jgi:hypothetical protein
MRDENYDRRETRERYKNLVPILVVFLSEKFPEPRQAVLQALRILRLSDEAIAKDPNLQPIDRGDED